MALRPQQRRIKWPLTPTQVEGIDEMFETLFRAFRNLEVSASIITGIIDVLHGGTGITTYAIGDLLYASAIHTLSRLAFNATPTRYLSNTGVGSIPAWDQVNLTNGVKNRLPFANLTAATAASKLLGRGDSGAGDFQEITLGTNLSMSGTTLNATGGSSGGSWSVLTNGDLVAPELIFAGGDVIMTFVP